jgi:hypothetical protein
MAAFGDLKTVNVSIGTLCASAAIFPVVFVPASHGAITVTSANVMALGTAGGIYGSMVLGKYTNAGSGTIPVVVAAGTLGTLPVALGTLATGVPCALTLASHIVSPGTAGCWLALLVAGTITAPTMVSINYLQGRDG